MRRSLPVLLGLVLACGLLHIWWLYRFRDGFPLDIDESRYLELGLDLKHGLEDGGPRGLWRSWAGQDDFGPLLPLSSVPVYLLFGEGVTNGLATQLGFYALLLLATYGIGARLTSPAGGLLAALVVAATPAVIDFTRSYQFAVTAAAMLAACTYALLASDGLTRRGWSIAWGVLLGLMVLARTMTIAFIPAQLAAAAWLALRRPGARRDRLVNLALGAGAGGLAAATWLATSWGSVWSYLTNLGYGAQSGGFGTTESRLSVEYWTGELTDTVRAELYLPLALLLCLGLGLGVAACIRARRWPSIDTAIVALVAIEGYLALTSSRNDGVGFRLPMLWALAVLAVAGIWSVRRARLRAAIVAALAAVCAVNVVMKANVISALSETETVDIPKFGVTPVLHGNGYIHDYVIGALEATQESPTHPLPDSQKRWMPAYRELAGEIRGRGPAGIATHEPLVNANSLILAGRLRFHEDLPVRTLGAPPGAASEASYRAVLSQDPAPGVLVTVSRLGLSYPELTGGASIDQALLRRAAASLGFERVAAVELPGDRRAIVSAR